MKLAFTCACKLFTLLSLNFLSCQKISDGGLKIFSDSLIKQNCPKTLNLELDSEGFEKKSCLKNFFELSGNSRSDIILPQRAN